MAQEEKQAWIMGVVTVIACAVYLVMILGRASGMPLSRVGYVWPMIWSVVVSIVVMIVLNIVVAIVGRRDVERRDVRDREIARFGDHVGQSFVVVGAVVALGLAMLEMPYFWISNAIYLGFVLSGVLSSGARIAAYRWGFQQS